MPPPAAEPETVASTRRLRPAKRAAIEAAGLKVFARQGYGRASIEAIADEAGVSTRTIYNHFESKQQLFATVLQASAAGVANRFLALLAEGVRHESAEEDLLVIAGAIAAHRQEFPDHFELVGRVASETQHLPESTIEAWQNAGPRVVNGALVDQLERMRDSGQLTVPDADLAAHQLIALTTVRASIDPLPNNHPVTNQDVTAAVAVFLHGYAAA